MDTLQRYLVEEAIEDYQEGRSSYESLVRHLEAMPEARDLIATISPDVTVEPARAMVAAANPLVTGNQTSEGSRIKIPGDGVEIEAYLSKPRGVDRAPAVIVIHENRGLQKYLEDVADGFASEGYIAVAPDLLTREGGTASLGFDDIPNVLSQIPGERHLGDLQAVVRYLQGRGDVTNIGVIGFCFGGGLTWRLATSNLDIVAAAPFYGSNPPLENVPNTNAAIFAVYGATDDRINAGIGAIREALAKEGKTHQMTIYAQSGHAFHNHTNPPGRFNPQAAKEAWSGVVNWFNRFLKGDGKTA